MEFEDIQPGMILLPNEDEEVVFFVKEKTDKYFDGVMWMRVDQEFLGEKVEKHDFNYYMEYVRLATRKILIDVIKELFE